MQAETQPLGGFPLKPDWHERPHFDSPTSESNDEHHFVGRDEETRRLVRLFLGGLGGTVLISGYRGVGKTATVDRALIEAASQARATTERRSTVANVERRDGAVAELRPQRLLVVKLDFAHIAPDAAASRATASGRSSV